MASIIMHLAISQILKQKYNFSNDFLIGTVAPDIMKRLPNAQKDITHYLKEYNNNNRIQKLPDIENFLKNNINEQSDYFYGYFVHLLQDRIWFEKYVPMFAEKQDEEYVTYVKDNTIHTEEEFSQEMYKDYMTVGEFILSKIVLDLETIKKDTKKYFNNELVNSIVDNEIIMYDAIKNRKNCFLTNELIENYINECIEECDKYISERKK